MNAKSHFVLSLDAGTTGVTAFLLSFTPSGEQKILASKTVDFKQYYPEATWVEHDLDEIWEATTQATKQACLKASQKDSGFHKSKIKSVGITNQRETLCLFSRREGKPLRKAIVWQCKRSLSLCEDLKKEGLEPLIKKKTGLLLDPYFTGTKLKWVLENEPEIKRKLESGEGLIGTIDTYLLYKLTRGKSFATEPSNASRTLLYNIEQNKWDPELLELMGSPNKDSLPEVLDSNSFFGKTLGLPFLPDGISINGILGDQQAALFGHTCFEFGESKCTYGTGAFFLMNTKEKLIQSTQGLLTTVASQIDGKVSYALEGSCFIAGAAVGFLRDNLGLIQTAQETGNLPEATEAAPDIYFVPALAGLGAPHWKPAAKGAFLGLTRSTSKDQMIKACLEGICFQVEDLLAVFRKEASFPIKQLSVDGGATANNVLMLTQAFISNLEVHRPKVIEATAYGAATLAAYGCGIVENLEDLKRQRSLERRFVPSSNEKMEALRQEQLRGWSQALKAVELFAKKKAE